MLPSFLPCFWLQSGYGTTNQTVCSPLLQLPERVPPLLLKRRVRPPISFRPHGLAQRMRHLHQLHTNNAGAIVTYSDQKQQFLPERRYSQLSISLSE